MAGVCAGEVPHHPAHRDADVSDYQNAEDFWREVVIPERVAAVLGDLNETFADILPDGCQFAMTEVPS